MKVWEILWDKRSVYGQTKAGNVFLRPKGFWSRFIPEFSWFVLTITRLKGVFHIVMRTFTETVELSVGGTRIGKLAVTTG